MKNFISPSHHVESFGTGSPIESMIDFTKNTLGLEYFAITDIGCMPSVLKGYSYAKKKGMKVIPGVEMFFKDRECEIVNGTPSENIKYFKIIIHAKDQIAYQYLVKLVSGGLANTVSVRGSVFPALTWKDLEELSKQNVTICSSDTEGMITKHLLVNRPDLSEAYNNKLQTMFADRIFYSILPFKQDKYWNVLVKLTYENGEEFFIPAKDRISTNKMTKGKAMDLVGRARNDELTGISINSVYYKIDSKYRHFKTAELVNKFIEFPGNELDIQTEANKLILKIANKNKMLLNHYAFFTNKKDKVVQNMILGEGERFYQDMYITSTKDVEDYLRADLGLSEADISQLVDNSHEWAKNFDSFELKYDYRLVDPGGDPSEILIDTIKKVGRMKWDDPKYVSQFRKEYELLTNNGVLNLIPYFLPIVGVSKF